MSIELECKVQVDSLQTVRDKLRAAGAGYVGRVLETNRLYDREDGRLRKGGCGLRVRVADVLDGTGSDPTLTYKGPRIRSAFKQREEKEVSIGDAGMMTEILQALGYVEQIVFQKCRESWLMPPCRVELDELPTIGTFVEIEGPDEKAIRSTMGALGLAETRTITRSYVSMIADLAPDGAQRPVALYFKKETPRR